MRFKTMTTITAVFFIAAGAAFIFKTWDLVTAYGGPEVLIRDSFRVMWMLRASSFANLYGTALLGSGLVIWAIRNTQDITTQTNVSLALFGMNAMAGAFALQMQISLWKSKTGAVTVAVFFAQAIGYCLLLAIRSKKSSVMMKAPSEPGVDKLREQWAQQIQEAAAQQERNRLARELHDSIKQQLFSINVSAATVQARWEKDEAGARAALEAVRGGAREAMAEMEAMLHSLRPAPLETVGLIEALRQQCESLQYRTGAQVTTEIGELPNNSELPPGTQNAIFRIAQEALANIARHARAKNVRVRLHRQTRGDEDTLWLRIEDDGSGFDVANAAPGMGLSNIRSRVLEIGGSLQLESSEGEGTSLVIHAPLAVTESREVRRELRVALVFALIGFFVNGMAPSYSSRVFWPLLGAPAFALSALGCYRAGKAIKKMKAEEAISQNKIWDLKIYLHQVRAILSGTLIIRLIEWIAAAGLVSFAAQLLLEYIFVPFWLSFQLYEVWRINRIIKLQLSSISPKEFHISVKRMCNPASWEALLVLPGLFILTLEDINMGPYGLFLIALIFHGLLVICWRVWSKRRMASASRETKGNYDPSRAG
ncbi:MAG: sensor histidine kinase [Acidobacteria bacterium]|nr:sensor histidine kinase [Acidobacteriota bacterium]